MKTHTSASLDGVEQSGSFDPHLNAGEEDSYEVILEIQHLYPGEVDYSQNPVPDKAKEFVQSLEEETPENYELQTVVTADDTGLDQSEKEGFLEDLWNYVQDSEVYIDTVAPESDAAEAVDSLLEHTGECDDPGLHDSSGFFQTDDKGYVYGEQQEGGKPKVKVVDKSPGSNKVTDHTCQAYDAAMGCSMVEESSVSMHTMPEGDVGIVLYDGFTSTPPYENSSTFTGVLEAEGVETAADSVADIELQEIEDTGKTAGEIVEVIAGE